ncbi:MAG: serine/threonine protein kinase, partial [Anaerolineae bacterium]
MSMKSLGDYTIIKQIGQGSLGTVFLAEHRFLKKPFAIKVLPEELASDRTFVQRFEKEILGISQLDHPHIVKIYNVSVIDGLYFLVADCIVDPMGETTNMAQFLSAKDRNLTEDEMLKIVQQVGSALDYAHQKNSGDDIPLAHRGLKLNNVLIGTGKEGISVHLCDFGLSRVIGTGTVLTRTYKVIADAVAAAPQVSISKGSPDKYTHFTSDPVKL